MFRSENCVVLYSGGLDSTVLVHWVKERYSNVYPLYINYGSTHKEKEYAAAVATCKQLNLELTAVNLTGDILSGSSLVDRSIETPDTLSLTINTVVPFRNLIMLALAACYADKVYAGVLATSPTKEDFEVFRDCRREFHDSLETTLKLGAKFDQYYQVLTPFVNYTKEEVIRMGVGLDVDFKSTWTCYNPTVDGEPCRVCPSCRVREKGFLDAGLKDPLISGN